MDAGLALIGENPLSRHDPFLESHRGDAEYEALMQQVKQRWQAFSA